MDSGSEALVRSDSSSLASTSYDPDHAELPGAKDRRAVSQVKLICIDLDGESVKAFASGMVSSDSTPGLCCVLTTCAICAVHVARPYLHARVQYLGADLLRPIRCPKMCIRKRIPDDLTALVQISLADAAGTLLDSRSKILPSSVSAIKAALDQGVLVCLATGKARPAAISALQSVGLAGKAITPKCILC